MTSDITELHPLMYESTTIIDKDTPRINLSTVEDVRREMAKVYRDSRQQKIMPSEGTKLVFMLTQILKAHELYMIEKRLSELELSYSRGSV
jgi:helix-turn-helix protein